MTKRDRIVKAATALFPMKFVHGTWPPLFKDETWEALEELRKAVGWKETK